jgi:hypothetical protein
MSAQEIIRELPKLIEAGRLAVRDVLLAIANENPDVALCNQTAQEGAMMFDRMGGRRLLPHQTNAQPGVISWSSAVG